MPGARKHSGFTVIEAMVVVGIIAILAGFAAPAMNQLIRTQKVRSLAYDLFADLTYARSQAISRGRNVGMGSLSGNDWGDKGWEIRDLTTTDLLRKQGPAPAKINFTADAGGVVFQANGRTIGTVSFTIAPVESAPDDQKRCVRIAPSGKPTSSTGAC
jgi:type IV fimbrial biogenesis protein FimT